MIPLLTAISIVVPAELPPPMPAGHEAPAELQARVDYHACKQRNCSLKDYDRLWVKVKQYHWVGQWYVEHRGLPPYMAWWLPAQCLRESGCGAHPVGDGGRSRGDFHAQRWVEDLHERLTGERIDREKDHVEVAAALMWAIADSFHRKTPRACGRMPQHQRLRTAVVRVTRGPHQCHFWVNGREIAGITVEWARKWWKEARR
jgi:hypothetical protein